MKSKYNERQAVGLITSGLIEQDNLALRTIGFVRDQLPAWRDDPNRPSEQSEPRLNSQLCDFLDSRARSLFPMVRFKHEEFQSGQSKVDVSAKPSESVVLETRLYTVYNPILVFECKRLPAPSSDREKEYVTGGRDRKTGGIQRFKLGLHGGDLDLVAMIGYLQERPANEWHHKINGWISEFASGTLADICIWSDGDKLKPLGEDELKGLACCQSIHSRIGSKSRNKIEIHHLWIAMDIVQKQLDYD